MRKQNGNCHQTVKWCFQQSNNSPSHNTVGHSNAIHTPNVPFTLRLHLQPVKCCRPSSPSRENCGAAWSVWNVEFRGELTFSFSCWTQFPLTLRLCGDCCAHTHMQYTETGLIIQGAACRIFLLPDSPGWTLLTLWYVWVCVKAVGCYIFTVCFSNSTWTRPKPCLSVFILWGIDSLLLINVSH